ncbi:YqzL family protein [Cohnella endophytica]|uniref:YqzL family protein n=1 Tax=Cohnella endophytica TaxID=2419778 RepID=A0A494Y4K3_9BACL|nr:YqzL family protein [Cohnella endophytica]RKP55226.1 YqzL family protein [Cohnella endophytica]
MRDFTWHVFTQTGDIEAYLLYNEVRNLGNSELGATAGTEDEENSVEDEE